MIYHSRSCLGLMIFLEYALSAAVSASRYLSLFFNHYFGIVRQSLLFSTCYIQTAYFYLGKVPLYNFIRLQTFQLEFLSAIFIHFTPLLRVVFLKYLTTSPRLCSTPQFNFRRAQNIQVLDGSTKQFTGLSYVIFSQGHRLEFNI